MILQQYYTSTDNPVRGSAGFGIRAQSPGIDQTVEQLLASAGAFFHPSDLPDEAVEDMPVSLSFYSIGGGLWGISHSKYVGQDYSKSRYGNYFAHSILCTEADMDAINWMPISLFDSAVWVTSEENSMPHELPTLPRLPAPRGNLIAETSVFVNQQSGGVLLLRQLIQAYIDAHSVAQGRRIVICDDYTHEVHWVAALSLCLPMPLRRSLSFTTYQQYEQFVRGGTYLLTCVERGSQFKPSQCQFDYFVFNRMDGQVSPGIEPGGAAIFLADALEVGDETLIAELGSLYEQFYCESPTALDVLVLIHRMHLEPIDSFSDDVIKRVCDFLADGQETARSVRLETVRGFTKSAMLCDDLGKLRMLLPVFSQLSYGRAEQVFETECLKFLQMQMETPQGMRTCELYVVDLATIPSLAQIVRKSMTPDDWVQFLTKSDPDSAMLQKWMPFLEDVFNETASRSELPLWEALADWSERHKSLVFVEAVSRLLVRQPRIATLSFARAAVSLTPDFGSEDGFAILTDTLIELVKQGAKEHDRSYSEDVALLADKLCYPVDMRPFYERVIQELSFSPAAVADVTSHVLRRAPLLGKPYLTMIAASQPDLTGRLLFGFTEEASRAPLCLEVVDLMHDGRQIVRVLWAVLSLAGPRPAGNARTLIARLSRKAASAVTDVEEVSSLVGSAPSLRTIPEALGYLLLTRARLTQDLTIFSAPGDLEAVEAVRQDYFGSLTAVAGQMSDPAFLSCEASRFRSGLLRGEPWEEMVSILADLKPASADDPKLFLAFVREAYENVASKRASDRCERLADIYVSTLRAELQKPLTALLAQTIKQNLNQTVEANELVNAILDGLERDGAALASIESKSFVPILKTLPRAELDLIDQKIQGGRKAHHLRSWWSDSYYLSTATIVQRVRDFFPGRK